MRRRSLFDADVWLHLLFRAQHRRCTAVDITRLRPRRAHIVDSYVEDPELWAYRVVPACGTAAVASASPALARFTGATGPASLPPKCPHARPGATDDFELILVSRRS